MSIDTSGWGLFVILTVMALVTLATRWGGVWVMSFVPFSPPVGRFIQGMSGSVLVALLAPLAMEGDTGARLALGTTTVVVLLTKRPLPGIALGIAVAAVWRWPA